MAPDLVGTEVKVTGVGMLVSTALPTWAHAGPAAYGRVGRWVTIVTPPASEDRFNT